MATIVNAPNGEKTSPALDDKLPMSGSVYLQLQNLLKIINLLTEDTAPAIGDFVTTYDTSASAPKKVMLGNLLSLIPRSGTMLNGKISVAVASNNITLSLKTLAGADASASDPIYVNINGTVRSVTAALSVTVNAGANTFNAGAAEFAALGQDYFAYLSWRAASSAVVIGFGRIPYARLYSHFSGTATDETYGAFSTAPASTDDVCVIGRFAATLSAAASYNWSVPAYTNNNLIQEPIFVTRDLTWAPQFTNLTVGNGTLSGLYRLENRSCKYQWVLVWGSTTSISGGVSHTLPFTRTQFTSLVVPAGPVRLVDTGTATFAGMTNFNASTTANLQAQNAAGTHLTQVALSSTVPHTWAATDEITVPLLEFMI